MGSKGIEPTSPSKWAAKEFGGADFGDQRLTSRLIKLADSFSESPESPINQACNSWAETKAGYRFFQNDSVIPEKILNTHISQTVDRSKKYDTVLAIQDTSYFSWGHERTKGLGIIARTPRGNSGEKTTSNGVVMHTSFAITTEGLPLGIFDQKTFARQPQSKELKEKKERQHNVYIPIEDKESIRWLESLDKTHRATTGISTRVVTICDREGDFYEFLEFANKIKASVLVRSRLDRKIKSSPSSKKPDIHLWQYMKGLPCEGKIQVEIPAQEQKSARTAIMEVRFGPFAMKAPKGLVRHRTEVLPNVKLNAVYIVERHPPKGEEALEWMLLTDLSITSFDEAVEKVRWYCLRWRIEVFHKILKSGLRVEACRLGTADRLVRYLTVMSIIAWRIFWITLIARSNPNLPCTNLLAEEEWKVLYLKIHRASPLPKVTPSIYEAVRWIARLGGFLARKGDGEPGPILLWRGWKRLCDLSEGWSLALA